jgi:hypothetical protein
LADYGPAQGHRRHSLVVRAKISSDAEIRSDAAKLDVLLCDAQIWKGKVLPVTCQTASVRCKYRRRISMEEKQKT